MGRLGNLQSVRLKAAYVAAIGFCAKKPRFQMGNPGQVLNRERTDCRGRVPERSQTPWKGGGFARGDALDKVITIRARESFREPFLIAAGLEARTFAMSMIVW